MIAAERNWATIMQAVFPRQSIRKGRMDMARNEYIREAMNRAPEFSVSNQTIASAWNRAIHTILNISTVSCPPETYNRTGLWSPTPGLMIRAGGGYPTPWTRDAAVNTMNAACFLEPEVAKNTLWAVCERVDGKLCFQMDNQSWDKIIWAAGAWEYYLATGDHEFLVDAYKTIFYSLSLLEKTQYREAFGLFAGGSFFNDGITGYPAELHQEGNESSFVGDHPAVSGIMSLSTNCLYYHAYCVLEKMSRILGREELCAGYGQKAAAVKAAVNRFLWLEEKGRYGYFVYPDGRVDASQEGCGLSFAILFGLCDRERAERILDHVEISRNGLVSIWPPFDGISSIEKPLRHNNLIWPFVNGYFASAAAKLGRADLLGEELTHVSQLVEKSGGCFYEIYNPETEEPDGGWQCGGHWDSVADQTWSATGLIRMIVFGLFGVTLHENGISFAPCLPEGLGAVSLKGLRIRNVVLDLCLDGADAEITKQDGQAEHRMEIRINGKVGNWIGFDAGGAYRVEMRWSLEE